MYIKKIINYILILVCAIIFCIAGFALGALYKVPKKTQENLQENQQINSVNLPEPSIAAEVSHFQGEKLAAITLKIDDQSLVIIDEEGEISRLAPPAFLPEDEKEKLIQGISFSTLEEVEVYLESIDS